MRLDAHDIQELRPVITAVVTDVLAELRADESRLGGERIGYTELEAAALLGVARHVLRDCRLRGEITARRVGSRYVYSRETLLRFLDGERGNRRATA